MEYGTQLAFWEDSPSESSIVFNVTYCVRGCPFHGAYEARGNEVTIYAQRFGRELLEPAKYLITVQKDFPKYLSDRMYHYISDDQWKAFSKIKELTGKHPLWRMSDADELLPSNYAGRELED